MAGLATIGLALEDNACTLQSSPAGCPGAQATGSSRSFHVEPGTQKMSFRQLRGSHFHYPPPKRARRASSPNPISGQLRCTVFLPALGNWGTGAVASSEAGYHTHRSRGNEPEWAHLWTETRPGPHAWWPRRTRNKTSLSFHPPLCPRGPEWVAAFQRELQ